MQMQLDTVECKDCAKKECEIRGDNDPMPCSDFKPFISVGDYIETNGVLYRITEIIPVGHDSRSYNMRKANFYERNLFKLKRKLRR
jgi:hypothetical protein